MKEFKSYTAREIIRLAHDGDKDRLLGQFKFRKSGSRVGSTYQFRQEGFHPKEAKRELRNLCQVPKRSLGTSFSGQKLRHEGEEKGRGLSRPYLKHFVMEPG